MKKKKKMFLGLFSILSTITPVASIIACDDKAEINKNYSLGMAINPVSSFNYIKYKSSVEVASPLVEGIAKGGPQKNSAIENYLKLDKLYLGDNTHTLDLSQFEFQTGTLMRSNNSWGEKGIVYAGSGQHTDKYSFNLNGKAKWANGEFLKSSDFIDALVYTLDLNTASQRINDIYELKIYGSREFVNAQNEYAKIFGKTYKNPFGYKFQSLPKNASDELKKVWVYWKQDLKDGFTLQSKNHPKASQEQFYVSKIKNAAKYLGIYGDKYSSHPHNPKEILGWGADYTEKSKNPILYNKDQVKPFKLDIKSNYKMQVFTFIVNTIINNSKNLIPINKNFVEQNGGIQEFGKSKSLFLSESPFKIKEATLGVNGYIVLQKDNSYWAADEIIPKSVKLFFQSDPIVLGTLFEDGYISSTKINSVYTKKFYGDIKLRNLIEKSSGIGGTGLILNLDKEKNKNKHLMNPNFRKALLLAVDREEIIKISGFDSTIPSYSLIETSSKQKSYIASDSGVSAGNTLNSERIFYSDSYSAPIISSSSIETVGLNQLFSHPYQKDNLRNIKLAREIMNQYRKEHNIFKPITITFLNDSTSFMINMGIALKSELKQVFGNQIKLEIKNMPKSLYDSYVASGDFEITWKNIDYLNSSTFTSGVDAFMVSDGIEKSNMKSTGYVENPTGSWTLLNGFNYYKAKKIEEKVRKRLRIDKNIWDKVKDLVTPPKIKGLNNAEINTLMKTRINSFFNKSLISNLPESLKDNLSWNKLDPNFDTNREIYQVILAANKIIMDQAAFIPLFRVDIIVKINRLPKINFQSPQIGYSYLYDLLRKPKSDLPGMEVKGV